MSVVELEQLAQRLAQFLHAGRFFDALQPQIQWFSGIARDATFGNLFLQSVKIRILARPDGQEIGV